MVPLAPVSSGAEAWVEVVTPHFTLSTDQPEWQARVTARNLEEVRAALLTLGWTGAHNPPRGRIDVIAFRSPSEFDRQSGQSAQADGVAKTRHNLPRLLAFGPGREGGIPVTIVHLVGWRQAWQEAFPGVTPAILDERMQAYLRAGGKVVQFTWPVKVEAFEPRVRALSEAERHGVLAQLQEGEPAKAEAAEALRLDPGELNALWVQFHALPSEADAARRELAQRAVAAHPKRSMSWLLLAQAESGAARDAALQRASALEPEHPGVLSLRAEELVRNGHAREALSYTDLALRRSAISMNLVQLHLEALLANGRCQEASSVEGNAEELFVKDCTIRRAGLERPCSEDLHHRWPAALRACEAQRRPNR